MGGGEASRVDDSFGTLADLSRVQATNVAGVTITNKSCLIMDEVDGMSSGDRGGVGALAALIRKSKVRRKPFL